MTTSLVHYDPTLAADIDVIRLKIGDTQENAGPRPDKRNFSQQELTSILSDENSQVNAAIAACFEILANEWTAWAISEREGELQFDGKEVAKLYIQRAAEYRAKPGGSTTANKSANLITLTRTDAYTS